MSSESSALPRRRWAWCAATFVTIAISCLIGRGAAAVEPVVLIRSDFPGGNVVVVQNLDRTVRLRPDLRGGAPWFYWHFEATASAPGPIDFVFEGLPIIGVRGAAVSLDGGVSWDWLGVESVKYAQPGGPAPRQESFSYEFDADHLTARFAVAVPYLERDLEKFLARHADNAHLERHVLSRTRTGRPVELLQVGEPRNNAEPMLVTARHHACESMASYVLEGWIEEAISDSPAGRAFRERYVLFAVPMVDKDGVQAGDQGKNRAPHDHNRDYGYRPIYPEVQAVQDLAAAQHIRYSLDLHCPALRGDVHEAFHFLGLGLPHIKSNVDEWIAWIREERPSAVMAPLNFLTDPAKPGAADRRINSHYFALRESSVFAATLEIPYTQPNCPLDAAMARSYGAGLLRAWVRTNFVPRDAVSNRGDAACLELMSFRTEFLKSYRGRPEQAEAMARTMLERESAARPEGHNSLALLRFHQRRHAEADERCVAALDDAQATWGQRATARLLRVQIAAADPKSSVDLVDERLRDLLQTQYLAADIQARAFEATAGFHHTAGRVDAAIESARRQLAVAAPHEQGTVLNRIAGWYDQSGRPESAVAARREAVDLLRPRLLPKPQRSIFGATMVLDLFDALCGIPTTTVDELREVAQMVEHHDVITPARKEAVRNRLAEMSRR